jgi:hypothetical protein
MDSLGMIIDVSHVGIQTISDILATTKNPIIASHSNARNCVIIPGSLRQSNPGDCGGRRRNRRMFLSLFSDNSRDAALSDVIVRSIILSTWSVLSMSVRFGFCGSKSGRRSTDVTLSEITDAC